MEPASRVLSVGMRILVIGGSSFVGRHFVQSALDRGHEVTLFNRGQTDPGAFPAAEHLVGDRNSDLSPLGGRSWDATVDVCAYVPKQVRVLLESLGDRAGHYTFISTISVYGQDVGIDSGFDETAPLLEPAWDDELVMEKYGELKVACELTARELAGDRLLVVRPGFVIGPHDPTHRFTYWVERVARGGTIAGPDADQPLQAVDGRDLGAFVAAQVEQGTVDDFHVTAPEPAPTFATWLMTIADALATEPPDIRWIGPRDELPLAVPEDWWPKMRAGLTKARNAGFTWRPLVDTIRDTYDWVSKARADDAYAPRPGVAPTPEQEDALLNS